MSCPTSDGNISLATFVTLTNGRRKRGLLDILPSLPLDILCEIFCFLQPADLLVLARTSKAFRRFLLKKSATFIWKSARRNVVDLPEPPSDMNEVHYASLVFGSGCHYQGCDRKARDTVWHLRIRSCASCRPKHRAIKVNECADYMTLRTVLARYPDSLEQYLPCGPFLGPKGIPVKGFQAHHIKSFVDGLRALPLSECQPYLDHHREATKAISKFASAGVAWQLEARNVRITELRNKRAARAEIIRESLVAAGFEEEIGRFGWDRIRKHPSINKQAMTDKVCSGVSDQLREYMLGWRELRMEEQVYSPRRHIFVDAWLRFTAIAFHNAPSRSPYLPLPPNATIGSFECIDSVIRQPGSISDESLLEQLHAAFLPACEQILEWHRTIRRKLASLLSNYRADDDDEAIHAQLNLATSVFQCSAGYNCRGECRTLTYPEILFHPCFTIVKPRKARSPKDPLGLANQKASLVMGGRWSCDGYVHAHSRQYVVNEVLLCCGKDPRSTTAAEMDKQNPSLVCLECAGRHRTITLMSWRCAVQHGITLHSDTTFSHPRFMASCATSVRINLVGSQNLQSISSMSGDTLSDYSVCLLCPPRIPSWNTRFGFGDLVDHIKNQHGIPGPAFGKHYAFDTKINPIYSYLAITKWQRSI